VTMPLNLAERNGFETDDRTFSCYNTPYTERIPAERNNGTNEKLRRQDGKLQKRRKELK